MNKIIFLDVDGTLLDRNGHVPESAKLALRQTKEKGNEIVLCTGRSKCQIFEELERIGFHGMVGCAGAYVERKGEEIAHHTIPRDKHEALSKFCAEQGILLMTQCKDGVFVTEAGYEHSIRWLEQNNLSEDLKWIFLNAVSIDDEIGQSSLAEKYLYMDAPMSLQKFQEIIGSFFLVVPPSFAENNGNSGEINEAGITKASGMIEYLKAAGADRDNVYAFGDSYNDIEMRQAAGIFVAMGNAVEDVKKRADFVTAPVDRDGIYYGLKQFGLI